MNRIFRIIWSVALGTWVVVSELAASPLRARRGGVGRACTASLLVIACSGAHASDLAFDGNGTWDTTRLAWFDGSAWRAWDNLVSTRAVFAAPGTVTLPESIVAGGLAFDAAGSHLLTGSGALTLDGARTIALAHGAQATIAVPLTGGFTVSSSGSGSLQIDRDNAATYSGIARVGSGATLVLGHRHALGTSTDATALVLEDGARLDFGVAGTFDFDMTLAGGRMRVVPRVVSGTWRGVPVPIAASELVFGAGANSAQTWSGALRDNGPHTLALAVETSDGFGPTLTGANTYGGATTLRSGMLQLANAAALSPNTQVVFAGRDDAYATLSLGWSGPLDATLGDGAGQWRWTGSGGFRNALGSTTVTFDDGARLAWGTGDFVPDGAALEIGRGITFTNPVDLGDALREVFGGGTMRGAIEGDGGLRVRGGTLVLAADNDWRGETHVASRNNLVFGAQLQLNHAGALPDASALVLDDGLLVLGPNGSDFLRAIGAGAGEVRFAGSGGFGSASGVRTVDLGGGGATLRWNAPGFVADGATLAFAGATAGASVLFRNGLDLDGEERRIDLAATTAPDNVPHRAVTLAGVIDNGGITIAGFGEAVLAADNTYTGRTMIGATETTTRVRVASIADGGIASGLGASSNAAANLVFGPRGSYYGVLVHAGEAASTDRGFTMSGNAELVADGSGPLTWTGAPLVANTTATDLRLGGTGTGHFTGMLADGSAALSLTKHGTGTWRLSGDNTFTGAVRIGGNSFGIAGSGVLEVSKIGNANQAGNLGINAANNPAHLSMFNRAVLRYLGAGEATNRNLQRGAQSTGGLNDRTGGIAIESSGTGALTWAGTIQMHHASNAWLRLGGTNEGDNILASGLQNAGQAISLAKDGSGVWALSGANTYTGTTDIVDGVLRIDAAHALAGGLGAADAAGTGVRLSGGILGLTGDFARSLGTAAGRNTIAWQGSGGFAAYGGTRAADLGGTGAMIAWGAPAFVGDGASLRLGHRTADGTLVFRNGIDLANGERAIEVDDGTHAVDAHLEGRLRGDGGIVKRDVGTLRIVGSAASRFTRIDVDAGRLALGTQGSVDGVQSVHVASGAIVDNAGTVRFTDGADSARIDGTWAGTGTFDFAGGDDALVATGAWAGDITLGAGNDAVTFARAVPGATHIDGGAGDGDHVAFLGMVLDAGQLPTFEGVERVRLLDASHAAIVDVLDLGAGTLEIDGSSSAYIATTARLRGHVDSAGLVRTGDARLAIEGDYIGREGAHLSVSISPANGIAGGLDIAGDVRGETGVVFASDGTQGFAPATILVVSAPDDRAGDGGFRAAEAIDGAVRLDGSPFAWSFEHDAAHNGWVLRTGDHAPLVPELPGYGALPTIAASATDDTHRILRERMSALRGDARTCMPQGHATIAGDCRGAWMAVFDGTLDVGANPGVAVRGDLRGMLAGTDRLFSAGDDPASSATFRAGLFGGLLQGDHATSGANSSPHAGVGAARLRSTTPVLGFHAGATTEAGRYLDAQLIAQRTVARVHATGGFEDTQRGTGLSMRAQAGTRHARGDWHIEPQLELGLAMQAWRDRYDAGGRDVVLADDATGHLRVAVRIERPFAFAAGTVRPWANVALADVRGEAIDALHLRAPTGEVFGLPNHARGLGVMLDVGVEAVLADGLHLHATVSAAESLQGTSSSARQATLGLRWRW